MGLHVRGCGLLGLPCIFDANLLQTGLLITGCLRNGRFYAAEVVLALEYLHCMGKRIDLQAHCPRILKCEFILLG